MNRPGQVLGTSIAAVAIAVLALSTVTGCSSSPAHSTSAPTTSASTTTAPDAPGWPSTVIAGDEMHLRDVFVVPDETSGWYYMVGYMGPGPSNIKLYRSKDLKTWNGPKDQATVFSPTPDFWGQGRLGWAPEIHEWKGSWYLFTSFATSDPPTVDDGDIAGTAILKSDHIDGPYEPIVNRPVTPTDRFAIDGTLYVDAQGKPWMAYSQEWIDPRLDSMGRMALIRLADDFTETIGTPTELFAATAAPWGISQPLLRVVDGPWIHRTEHGELLMLWSSIGQGGQYVTGIARSTSGTIRGPWVQQCRPLYDADGGHAMVFHRFDGQLMVALHTPNKDTEHPLIVPVAERDGTLVITDPSVPKASGAACR